MLVRYHPLPINLAEEKGRAPPHIELLSVCLRRANVADTVRECHVVTRSDVQIPNLVTYRALALPWAIAEQTMSEEFLALRRLRRRAE
jgi:hypothetical protein